MQGGRGGKRGRQEYGGGKPGKKRYVHKAPASVSKSGIPLQSQGILVSCTNSKEQVAGREALALFTESYEQLGGTWKQQADAPPAAAAGAEASPTDIAAALASEVMELKDSSKHPFYYHPVGIHSVVYVECKDCEGPFPAALVQHTCQRVADSQQNQMRHCTRFYPVEHTCYASMEKIQELAARVVEQHFSANAEQPIEFAVSYNTRAAPPLDRMEVINAFASLVPKPHKVNLGSPQKTILVNLVKAVCGVAVVERFKELCRYNIRTLALPEEEREAQREAQRFQTKSAQPGKQEQAQESGGEQAAAEVAEEQQQGEQQQQQQQKEAKQQQQQQKEAKQQQGQQVEGQGPEGAQATAET